MTEEQLSRVKILLQAIEGAKRTIRDGRVVGISEAHGFWGILEAVEFDKLNKFITKHSKCKMREEDAGLAPHLLELHFVETTVGSCVYAKCSICGNDKDISSDSRSNW